MFSFKRKRPITLSQIDHLIMPAPSTAGYIQARLQRRITHESFSIQLVCGSIEVLKSYNCYRLMSPSLMRPFLVDLEALDPGTQMLVKAAPDGDWIALLPPLGFPVNPIARSK